MKGEVKKRQQKECHYGPDGKVQKTLLPGGAAEEEQQQGGGRRRGGAVKGAIVKKKVGETKEYMERVAALVHEYVPPDAEKIQAAHATGKVSVQPSQGLTTLAIKDYLKSGDSLSLGFDSNTKKMRSYDVHSYLDKPKEDDVTLAVNFASLPDGTNYAQQTVLDVPGKKMQVKVTNSGYAKTGQ